MAAGTNGKILVAPSNRRPPCRPGLPADWTSSSVLGIAASRTGRGPSDPRKVATRVNRRAFRVAKGQVRREVVGRPPCSHVRPTAEMKVVPVETLDDARIA